MNISDTDHSSNAILNRNLQHNPYVDSFPRGSPVSPYPSLEDYHKKSKKYLKQTSILTSIRTTKKGQKLVLLPDQHPVNLSEPNSKQQSSEEFFSHLIQEKQDFFATPQHTTQAERTLKEDRFDLPRVSSYCVAEGYKLEEITKFLNYSHGVNGVSYDECLHASYEVSTKFAVLGLERPLFLKKMTSRPLQEEKPLSPFSTDGSSENVVGDVRSPNIGYDSIPTFPLWMLRSDVFFFDYGVIVFWNFTKEEEEKFISLFKQFAINPIRFDNYEVDELNFQYDLSGPQQPRIFNDIITLKSSNHLIKLTISHGIAQSVKLSLFCNIMEETIDSTIALPHEMSKYGKINMERTEVMKIVGELFDLRMNVNLVSNVLDTPEIFWSERELQGLYQAVRAYFEISQRAALLNKRLEVVGDLLNMLSDLQNFGNIFGCSLNFINLFRKDMESIKSSNNNNLDNFYIIEDNFPKNNISKLPFIEQNRRFVQFEMEDSNIMNNFSKNFIDYNLFENIKEKNCSLDNLDLIEANYNKPIDDVLKFDDTRKIKVKSKGINYSEDCIYYKKRKITLSTKPLNRNQIEINKNLYQIDSKEKIYYLISNKNSKRLSCDEAGDNKITEYRSLSNLHRLQKLMQTDAETGEYTSGSPACFMAPPVNLKKSAAAEDELKAMEANDSNLKNESFKGKKVLKFFRNAETKWIKTEQDKKKDFSKTDSVETNTKVHSRNFPMKPFGRDDDGNFGILSGGKLKQFSEDIIKANFSTAVETNGKSSIENSNFEQMFCWSF
ncbi:hypothetical protein HK099_006250 [Clydaea vesicula]|uniref:DUF155 domain-containing protein n=1 Tax=Clydaea vesicula TaxID=447962 RepID=A0AAD5XYD0_9FUNG|nr:hypothetical protein HK099_006250 [Clydaea vesicula]